MDHHAHCANKLTVATLPRRKSPGLKMFAPAICGAVAMMVVTFSLTGVFGVLAFP